MEPLASLALDVDTSEDLEAMVALLDADSDRAAATADALGRLGRIASGARR